jgi:hypothetical protein
MVLEFIDASYGLLYVVELKNLVLIYQQHGFILSVFKFKLLTHMAQFIIQLDGRQECPFVSDPAVGEKEVAFNLALNLAVSDEETQIGFFLVEFDALDGHPLGLRTTSRMKSLSVRQIERVEKFESLLTVELYGLVVGYNELVVGVECYAFSV